MTKQEVEIDFFDQILPLIVSMYEADGVIDRPARCEEWNNYTDALCKNGEITESQYNDWLPPRDLETRRI